MNLFMPEAVRAKRIFTMDQILTKFVLATAFTNILSDEITFSKEINDFLHTNLQIDRMLHSIPQFRDIVKEPPQLLFHQVDTF